MPFLYVEIPLRLKNRVEEVPFPEAELAQHLPHTYRFACVLQKSIGGPISWIFMLSFGFVGALLHTAKLDIIRPTLYSWSNIWGILLHPGAVNTSSFVKLFSRAARLLEDHETAKYAKLVERWRREERERGDNDQIDDDRPPRHSKRFKRGYEDFDRVSITTPMGSYESCGDGMSRQQVVV